MLSNTLTYEVSPDRRTIIAIEGTGERPVEILKWGSSPDLALSVLCDLIGEQPSPKKIAQENFKAAPYLRAFRRQFSSGMDLRPGQKVGAIAVKIWLRKQGVQV